MTRAEVIAELVALVESTFPEDWTPDRTVRDVVRGWLIERIDG